MKRLFLLLSLLLAPTAHSEQMVAYRVLNVVSSPEQPGVFTMSLVTHEEDEGAKVPGSTHMRLVLVDCINELEAQLNEQGKLEIFTVGEFSARVCQKRGFTNWWHR